MTPLRSHRRQARIALLIVFLAAGCATKTERPNEVVWPNISLPAEFVNSGEYLAIHYRFENNFSYDLLFFDELPASNTPGARDFDRNAIYIQEDEVGRVTLSKHLQPPPKGYQGASN